jgi:Fur family ferric uptake transcriptional regulator
LTIGNAEAVVEVAGRLRRDARRMTGPRRAILRSLASAARPLSCREVHATLAPDLCDLVTVYRSLHLLEAMEAVQRFDLGDGVARYRLRRADGPGHCHHLVCRICSRVIELKECVLDAVECELAKESGYVGLSHRLQFFGVCPVCQRRSPPTTKTPAP